MYRDFLTRLLLFGLLAFSTYVRLLCGPAKGFQWSHNKVKSWSSNSSLSVGSGARFDLADPCNQAKEQFMRKLLLTRRATNQKCNPLAHHNVSFLREFRIFNGSGRVWKIRGKPKNKHKHGKLWLQVINDTISSKIYTYMYVKLPPLFGGGKCVAGP